MKLLTVMTVTTGVAAQIFSPGAGSWRWEGPSLLAAVSDECGAAVENCSGLQWTAVTVTVVIMR